MNVTQEDLRAAFTAGWNAGVLARDAAGSIVGVGYVSDETMDAKIVAQIACRNAAEGRTR